MKTAHYFAIFLASVAVFGGLSLAAVKMTPSYVYVPSGSSCTTETP